MRTLLQPRRQQQVMMMIQFFAAARRDAASRNGRRVKKKLVSRGILERAIDERSAVRVAFDALVVETVDHTPVKNEPIRGDIAYY